MTKFTEFFSDDAGAVTIDWITLTAGILLLGILVVYAIYNGGWSNMAPNINTTLAGTTTNVIIGTIVLESDIPIDQKCDEEIEVCDIAEIEEIAEIEIQ